MVDATTLSAIAGSTLVIIGSHFASVRKLAKFILANTKTAADVANDVVHTAEDIAKLPVVAELKAKLANKESSFKNSEIGRIAGAFLHAYEAAYGSLSENQKGTLFAYLRAEFVKAGFNVTDEEILRALDDFQKYADMFKATDAFKNTQSLEANLRAMKQAQQSQNPAIQSQPVAPVQSA